VKHETQIFIAGGAIESLVGISEQLHFLSFFSRELAGEIIGVKNRSDNDHEQREEEDQLVSILLFVDIDHRVKLEVKGER